jgi:adenylate cyclase
MTLRRGRAARLLEQSLPLGRNNSGPRGLDVHESHRARLSRDKPSVAILPCQASATEPAHLWFVESVVEGIAAALCSVRSLSVIFPGSSRRAMRDPQRSARELGTRYFLTGRIMPAGSRLRLIIRVAETATGHHVWGDSYDGERDRLLALQDRVVEGVTRDILSGIRGAEIDHARRTHPRDLDAHGLAMRALPLVFASRPDATRRALDLLNRAIEIDPDYGLATALAAWCHGQLVMYNGTDVPADDRTWALRLAHRAAILDTDDPLVLTARCAVHTMAREFEVAQ